MTNQIGDEVRKLRDLLALCGDERQRYYEALLAVRSSIMENADDTVWMSDGIETVVDYISAAVGEPSPDPDAAYNRERD